MEDLGSEILHCSRSGLDWTQCGAVTNGAPQLGVHVERDRLEAWLANLEAMWTGFEVRLLQRSVEVVHDAEIVAVGVDLSILLRQVEADTTVWLGVAGAVIVRTIAQAVAVRAVPVGCVGVGTVAKANGEA